MYLFVYIISAMSKMVQPDGLGYFDDNTSTDKGQDPDFTHCYPTVWCR